MLQQPYASILVGTGIFLLLGEIAWRLSVNYRFRDLEARINETEGWLSSEIDKLKSTRPQGTWSKG